jgi:phytoene desaturase (3,4-didehydrolycopene-forming)
MSDNKGSSRKKAIVVGAGVGGTATAARLAHAGLDVEVYEKNEFSGGRCSLIHHDGYRFDQVSLQSQYDHDHNHLSRDTLGN